MRTLDFGKHEGEKLAECPVSYIKWLANHKMVLAERNRWASRLAQKLLKEKEMQFQVGQVVKNLRPSRGPRVYVATITKIDGEKIFATLPEGGTYEYTADDFAPATEQDIVAARKTAELEAEMRNPEPLGHIDVPAVFGLFDEDGVRIA